MVDHNPFLFGGSKSDSHLAISLILKSSIIKFPLSIPSPRVLIVANFIVFHGNTTPF